MDSRLMTAALLSLASSVIWIGGYWWKEHRERLDEKRLSEFKANSKGPNFWGENGYASDLQRDRTTIFIITSVVGMIPMAIALTLLLKP